MSIILDYSDEGLPIYWNPEDDKVQYKDTTVPFLVIKRAIESSIDRHQLASDLTMEKSGGFVTFGCLTLSHEKCKTLIKSVLWNKSN